MKKNGMKRALAWVALAMVLAGGCAAQQSGFGNLQPSTAPYQPFAPPYDCQIGQKPIKLSVTMEELNKGLENKDMVMITIYAFAMVNKAIPGKGEKEGVEMYKIAADGGNAFAQYELGFRHAYGKTLAENHEEGVNYFRKSAEQGYCSAKLYLGKAYLEGRGAPKDPQMALRLIDEAARMGNMRALHDMGHRYSGGDGVPQSQATGTAYFKWAAEQGWAPSQYAYGTHLMRGLGVRKDEAAGAAWQLKAAEQNEPNAQFETGMNYLQGVGVKKDVSLAVEWLNKGAQNGSAPAQFTIGEFIIDSKDKEQRDYGEQLLNRASKQGDDRAMFLLGQWMAANKKSGEDLTQALTWLMLSSKNPQIAEKANPEISKLKAKLKPAQVKQAESQASQFVAKSEN